MALDKSVRVDIPEHSVLVKNKDNTYVQYTVRSYRNSRGQPTSERVSIGKLDKDSGRMIPNRRYYELFSEKEQAIGFHTVKKSGSYAAFSGVAGQLGLEKLVRRHFGSRADDILTVAHYMLCEGNVMYYLSDWQEDNISYASAQLGSAALSRLFASIDIDSRIGFFNDWLKLKYSNEYIAYDVTSISSYGKGMESLEWGYNRDKEKLPQINLGMYYGQNSMLPLYYRIYPGSIPDKAHLRYMTEDTGVISCKKARYVMDRGFYSAENLKYLAEKNCRFIIALPASLKYCRELIERHKSEIINRYEYSLGVGKPYGKVFEVTDLGFRMNVHMYYDADKAARDAEVIRMEVEKIEAELREMEEPPARNLHYDKYFFINRNSKDDSLSFRRNDAAINKSLDQCGFFLIAETDFKKTTAEILDIYRRRDIIEKSFDSLKNDIDMKRLYIHSDEIAEGKTFVAFLALIVRSQMHNLLQKYMYDNRYTFRKILLELDKAKLIIAADRISGCRLLNPPSKTLRDILSLLGCDTNSLSVV